MSRQDRLAADVDRGFTALEAGKFDEAEACLERCSRIDRKHADVVALAAAVADARGDGEAALAKYRELSELRPDDPMPRVCLARLQLHDELDPDAALETIEAAFDFIDEEDDLIEAVSVRTEALIAIDDLEGARGSLGELSTSVIDDPRLALDLADLALSAGDPSMAIKWVDIAKRDADLKADALHLLGFIHMSREDDDAMIEAWREVRTLDAKLPPPEVTMSEDEVERIARAAFAELPAEVQTKLADIPIMIDDVPSEELVDDGLDPRVLGVFDGANMREDAMGKATHIRLFKTNLERGATDLDHLAEEIRITVLHETAHYFGLEDEDLEKIGLE